jgi:PAS domain S-box-containing protein
MVKLIKDSISKLKEMVQGAESANMAFERTNALMTSLVDEHGNFVKVSARYCEFLGYAEAELLGRHFSVIVAPEKQAKVTHSQQRYISGLNDVPFAWTLIKKSGERVVVFVDAVRITDEEGRKFKLAIIEEVH